MARGFPDAVFDSRGAFECTDASTANEELPSVKSSRNGTDEGRGQVDKDGCIEFRKKDHFCQGMGDAAHYKRERG